MQWWERGVPIIPELSGLKQQAFSLTCCGRGCSPRLGHAGKFKAESRCWLSAAQTSVLLGLLTVCLKRAHASLGQQTCQAQPRSYPGSLEQHSAVQSKSQISTLSCMYVMLNTINIFEKNFKQQTSLSPFLGPDPLLFSFLSHSCPW